MSKIKHTIYTKNDQDKVELTPALRSLAKKVITAALDYQEIDFPVEVSLTFTDDEIFTSSILNTVAKTVRQTFYLSLFLKTAR